MSAMYNTHKQAGWLCKLNLMIMLFLVFGQRGVHTMSTLFPALCGSRFSDDPVTCGERGHFLINLNPSVCETRTYCYIGPGMPCKDNDPTSECMRGLTCSCDKCQKTPTLCPKATMMGQWPKRLQPNFLEYAM